MNTASSRNISFNGEAVEFLADSPLLAVMDPIMFDGVREGLKTLSSDKPPLLEVLETQEDLLDGALAYHEIADFSPGIYRLDPRDIRKFGSNEGNEDDDCEEV